MKRKILIPMFWGFVIACVLVASGYVWLAASRSAPTAAPTPLGAGVSSVNQPAADITAILQKQPHLISLNRVSGPTINSIQLHPLAAHSTQMQSSDSIQPTALRCERAYFAGGTGICLLRYFPNPFTAVISVTVFGPDLQPRFVMQTEGIPTRARVSPDGRYAVYTVFVTGHSYTDARMSTATVILDVARQRELGGSENTGNLETFQVFQRDEQGIEQRISAPDFNFWGVTFGRDSNQFYATLRTAGENWLVEGDIAQRRIRMLRKEVECPSLSPDGKRIAFKKLKLDNTWQLHVLELATLQDKPLAETRNVDDQVEWLDDDRILYEMYDLGNGSGAAVPRTDIMVINADGSGSQQVFLPNAASPSVQRK
jgi:hypothetical protein